MKINKSDLDIIAVAQEGYPQDELKEVAFIGRSNVGKSSLINGLLGRKNLARTSGTPGKTRTINFYIINDTFRFVDLPGYGFAVASKKDKQKWAEIITEYLNTRQNLKEIFLLLDIRHAPTDQDIEMYKWIKDAGFTGYIIFTKADKIAKTKVISAMKKRMEELSITNKNIAYPFSTTRNIYKEDVLSLIENIL